METQFFDFTNFREEDDEDEHRNHDDDEENTPPTNPLRNRNTKRVKADEDDDAKTHGILTWRTRRFELFRGANLVGNGDISGVDIEIADASVSPIHAEIIFKKDGRCFVKDLESEQSTQCETRPGSSILCKVKRKDPKQVESGANIRFGNCDCLITFPADTGESTATKEKDTYGEPTQMFMDVEDDSDDDVGAKDSDHDIDHDDKKTENRNGVSAVNASLEIPTQILASLEIPTQILDGNDDDYDDDEDKDKKEAATVSPAEAARGGQSRALPTIEERDTEATDEQSPKNGSSFTPFAVRSAQYVSIAWRNIAPAIGMCL
jgi:hypothetical protein